VPLRMLRPYKVESTGKAYQNILLASVPRYGSTKRG
jgi:hypothetical protein